MNRTDRGVIAGLVLVLAFSAVAIGGPSRATQPGAQPSDAPTESPPAPYREGALGRPVSVSPLGARTQVDRDLVALVFEGLVKLDADGHPMPALASSWTSDAKGATWTFHLRPDARWQDDEPVTADDVVFTVDTLRNVDYHGPGAGSWLGITATAVDARTVRFDLADPFAGFLELTAQPIAPKHLLGDTPVAGMAGDPFGAQPVGSGPYAVLELDRDHAVLRPAPAFTPPDVDEMGATPGTSNDPLAPSHPTPRPSSAQAGLARLEFRFYDTAAALTTAYRSGVVDAASGLSPLEAATLGTESGSRLVRDPSTNLVAVLLNLRPSHPEFRDPKVRYALLQALDRTAILQAAFGGQASRADAFLPPSSWGFDAKASPELKQNARAASKALSVAGWTQAKDGWRAPDAKAATVLELLVPNRTANAALYAVGAQVAADWKAIGLVTKIVEVDPAILAADHLRTGGFAAAVVDIALGHDPDLYPLLASSQTQTGGANVMGLQDPLLDGLLEAARKPATDTVRKAALVALQTRLTGGTYSLPIAWPDSVFVVRQKVIGPAVRTVSDGSERFWDVLTWRLAGDR
ncbi:MAG TPA: peptide ABC transporter substrate-binding protein [Candidatus Limnocylindrales bacterium]|nr:peptide ABC transporter substrate-binding protein [Candidatus Limnocylindrales bacterium]